MTEQSEIELPIILAEVTNRLVAGGVPPYEVVSALIGAGIDLAVHLIGPDRARTYIAGVAIRLDEELHFHG